MPMQQLLPNDSKRILRAMLTGCVLAISTIVTGTAHAADEPVRVAARDAQGREVFVIEQVYVGKKPTDPKTRVPHNPDDVDTDFYKVSFHNPTGQPVMVKRFAAGLRYGTGTVIGQKSSGGADAWGAGLQERDLVRQPMFADNVLAAGRTVTSEYFIYGKTSPNYFDRAIMVEHEGKTYELKWEMRYVRGSTFR